MLLIDGMIYACKADATSPHVLMVQHFLAIFRNLEHHGLKMPSEILSYYNP
jgi:hypothetical protein